MKKLLLILLFIPLLSIGQSKKKKIKLEQQANEILATRLKTHVRYLADDKLEGRRTGTNGEILAMEYISSQYNQIGLEPKGNKGYMQEFDIDEGKQCDPETTFLAINNKKLELEKEFFPLAFSASKSGKCAMAVALNEGGQPWFKDMKDVLEDNQSNPHFDIEEAIKKDADKIAGRGATA